MDRNLQGSHFSADSHAIGRAIKHDGLSRGIPHGYGANGWVSNGRSPMRIADLGHRRIHHCIPTSFASLAGPVQISIAMLSGKLRMNFGMFRSMIAVTLRSSSGGPLV